SSTDVKTELAAGSPGRRIGLPRFPFMIAATVVRSTPPFGFGPLWQSRQYVRKTGRTSLANVTFAAGGGSVFGSAFFGPAGRGGSSLPGPALPAPSSAAPAAGSGRGPVPAWSGPFRGAARPGG